MRTSVVPELIDALIAAATTPVEALGARVEDGYGVSDDLGDVLFIGADDPFSPARATSADMQQVPGPGATTRPRDENGTIHCAVLTTDGGAVQKVARDKAHAISAAVAALVRNASGPGIAAPVFGIAGLREVGFGGNGNYYQNQSSQGAEALLMFDVNFTARI